MKKINFTILSLNFKFCLNSIPNSKEINNARWPNAIPNLQLSLRNPYQNEYLNQHNPNGNYITPSNYDLLRHFSLDLSNSNSRYQIYNDHNLFNYISIPSNSIPKHGINPHLQSNSNQESHQQSNPPFDRSQNHHIRSSDHPSDSSHQLDQSVIDSNLSYHPHGTPLTLTQESNSLDLHSNLPDLSQFSLAPFYVVASLHYPYHRSSEISYQIHEVVEDAIRQSFFNDKLPFRFELTEFSRSSPERSLPIFLLNLCLQNIAFLYALNSQAHDQVLNELKLTLNWLYDQIKQPNGSIIQSFNFASTDSSTLTKFPNPNVAKTLYDFLQLQATDNESFTVLRYKQPDKTNPIVRRIEAEGARTTLILLSHYYKYHNLEKWRYLFPGDIFFVKLYLRIAQAESHRDRSKYLKKIQPDVQLIQPLPWINRALENKLNLYRLYGQSTISCFLQNHLTPAPSTEELIELERQEIHSLPFDLKPYKNYMKTSQVPFVTGPASLSSSFLSKNKQDSSMFSDMESDLPSTSRVITKQRQKDITDELQAIDSTKGNINPFDMTEFSLIPFYVMAALNYPLTSSDQSNQIASRTIQRVIVESSMKLDFHEFGIPVPGLLSPKKPLIYESSRDVTSKQGFIIRLCLKNLAFIRCIGSNSQSDLSETLNMLDWLKSILDRPTDSDPPNKIESLVLKLVQEHLQIKNLGNLNVQVLKSNSNDKFKSSRYSERRHQEVTEFQAQEAKIILNVLGNYYKSQNILKWRRLFKQDWHFLNFYIKLAGNQISPTSRSPILRDFVIHKRTKNYLPWKENVQVEDVPKRFTGLRCSYPSTMVKSHLNVDFASEAWKKLKLDEKKLKLDEKKLTSKS